MVSKLFPLWECEADQASGQYFVDKDHFALIARLDDKGLWRVSYGEKEGMSEEEMCDPKRVAEIFEILFPGPRPLEYKCVSSRSYMMHQRCCDTFRKGRALLAGDAARLNNPFGVSARLAWMREC